LHTTEMAAKDVLSRPMLHNLHAFLYHRALSQKEHNRVVTMRKSPKRLLSLYTILYYNIYTLVLIYVV